MASNTSQTNSSAPNLFTSLLAAPIALPNSSSSNSSSSSSGSSNMMTREKSRMLAGSSGSSSSSIGYVNLNRGVVSPSKILGAIMKIHSDLIRQAIVGIEMNFTNNPIPSEITTSLNELDAFINSINNNYHSAIINIQPTNTTIINTNANNIISTYHQHGLHYDDKIFDVIATDILLNPLREPFRHDALQEVFDLYDNIEYLFQQELHVLGIMNPNELEVVMQQQQQQQYQIRSGLGSLFGTTTSNAAFGNSNDSSTIITNSNNNNTSNNTNNNLSKALYQYLNFKSVTSPFYDAMNTYQLLSKEGEVVLTQKILNKLLDLVKDINIKGVTDVYDNFKQQINIFKSKSSHQKSTCNIVEEINKTSSLLYIKHHDFPLKVIENMITSFCSLILRCLKALSAKVRREIWVADVVQDGLQRVVTSFVLSLQRYVDVEFIFADDSGSSYNSSSGGNSIGVMDDLLRQVKADNQHHHQQHNHHNNIKKNAIVDSTLHTMSEELKYVEVDQKHAWVQIGLIRACMHLRTSGLSFIYQKVRTTFPVSNDLQININDNDNYNNYYDTTSYNRVDMKTNKTDKNIVTTTTTSTPAITANTAATTNMSGTSTSPKKLQQTSLLYTLFSNNDISNDEEKHHHHHDHHIQHTITTNDPSIISSSKFRLFDIMRASLSLVNQNNTATTTSSLFTQNLHDIIKIENQACVNYISIKEKQLRLCVFTSYGLVMHREFAKEWTPLKDNSNGEYVYICIYIYVVDYLRLF